jgi:hypothetical protein
VHQLRERGAEREHSRYGFAVSISGFVRDLDCSDRFDELAARSACTAARDPERRAWLPNKPVPIPLEPLPLPLPMHIPLPLHIPYRLRTFSRCDE